jgi:hypothetical protein
MFNHLLCVTEGTKESIFQFFDPTVIAALIAAFIAFFSVLLSFRTLKLQRIESERQEIYKKLNSFYGPMRLHLNSSNEFYELFRTSIKKRIANPDTFRTLPFILNGNVFSDTEKELLSQIIKIGKKMEKIINQNAGLIDDDNLHKEMTDLNTHIIIIRSAYNGKFETGREIEELLKAKTFPNEITNRIDATFKLLKKRLT